MNAITYESADELAKTLVESRAKLLDLVRAQNPSIVDVRIGLHGLTFADATGKFEFLGPGETVADVLARIPDCSTRLATEIQLLEAKAASLRRKLAEHNAVKA